MGVNIETAKKAEKIARRMCRDRGRPEALWQLCLSGAYAELFDLEQSEQSKARTDEAFAGVRVVGEEPRN